MLPPPKKVGMDDDEEALINPLRSQTSKTGFTNVILTSSGKFQARMYVPSLGGQRAIGSFETPEDAALALALAKRDGPGWRFPPRHRARRGRVRQRTRTQPPHTLPSF